MNYFSLYDIITYRVMIMDKYLFSTDMDGTILNSEHLLSENTIINIKKIVNDGHIFVLNTGRPYQGMINFKNQLNINCPYVCDNGSSIYWDNNPDFPIFFSIDKNIIKKLFTELNDILYCAMLNAHQIYYFQNKSLVPSFIIHINSDTKVYEGIIKDIINDDIVSITIHINKDFLDLFKQIMNKYPLLSYRYWGEYDGVCAVDIFKYNANKGTALDYLKNYLKIKPNHTIGFGDDLNDIELIKHADTGVAMINSCDELKKESDDITFKPHYEDGVCDYIFNYLEKQKRRK